MCFLGSKGDIAKFPKVANTPNAEANILFCKILKNIAQPPISLLTTSCEMRVSKSNPIHPELVKPLGNIHYFHWHAGNINTVESD